MNMNKVMIAATVAVSLFAATSVFAQVNQRDLPDYQKMIKDQDVTSSKQGPARGSPEVRLPSDYNNPVESNMPKSSGTTAPDAMGSGATGMEREKAKNFTGTLSRSGAGYVLMSSGGQQYALDASRSNIDLSRFLNRQVTVTGDLVSAGLPASGTTTGAMRTETIIVRDVK